jgi:hypothetical protein
MSTLATATRFTARSPQKAAQPIVAVDKKTAQTPANTASVTALVKKISVYGRTLASFCRETAVFVSRHAISSIKLG